ncbi:MAG: ferric reductase-like transmembrane domain-containing protein [Paracoccaceae bacterium]
MSRIVNSIPLLYILMLWPGRYSLWGLIEADWYYPWMMYDSGIWSIRLLILTIAVTPTLKLINRLGRGKAFGRWLLQRRRHFGLASFIFGVAHLIHYVLETNNLRFILTDILALEFAVGWLGFAIFAVLAMTSNNWSVRYLGRAWKSLHLWVYPAAVLTFLHWYLFDEFTGRVMYWLAILIGVKLFHGLLLLLSRVGKRGVSPT